MLPQPARSRASTPSRIFSTCFFGVSHEVSGGAPGGARVRAVCADTRSPVSCSTAQRRGPEGSQRHLYLDGTGAVTPNRIRPWSVGWRSGGARAPLGAAILHAAPALLAVAGAAATRPPWRVSATRQPVPPRDLGRRTMTALGTITHPLKGFCFRRERCLVLHGATVRLSTRPRNQARLATRDGNRPGAPERAASGPAGVPVGARFIHPTQRPLRKLARIARIQSGYRGGRPGRRRTRRSFTRLRPNRATASIPAGAAAVPAGARWTAFG